MKRGHFRAMHRAWAGLLIGTALASCGSQAERELEAVKSARSVLAEWALAEERHGKGGTTSTYVEQMREESRKQLRTSETELAGRPGTAALIEQILGRRPDAAALQRARLALAPLERSLEPA